MTYVQIKENPNCSDFSFTDVENGSFFIGSTESGTFEGVFLKTPKGSVIYFGSQQSGSDGLYTEWSVKEVSKAKFIVTRLVDDVTVEVN